MKKIITIFILLGVTAIAQAEESKDPIVCTMEYAPVCGQIDTDIRCITEPCPSTETQTYGNDCMAEGAGATILYEGECSSEDIEENIDVQDIPDESAPDIIESLPNEEFIGNEVELDSDDFVFEEVDTDDMSGIGNVFQKIKFFFANILNFLKKTQV